MEPNHIYVGNCKDRLTELAADSVDLLCTDPPYGYSFMGKDWDKAVPSVEIWKECLRVLKPGAFAFVMSAPRQDVLSQMIVRLGEAGFETGFTSIYWTYASGFPKAMNIGKAVDKRNGREFHPEVKNYLNQQRLKAGLNRQDDKVVDITLPATSQAKTLDGSYGGFQPKPAVEVIIVAMKPLSEKTYVDQALKNGKGVTWLDDGRIPGEERENTPMGSPSNSYGGFIARNPTTTTTTTTTRFVANLLSDADILGDYSKFFDLDAWWAKILPFLIVPKAAKGEKNGGLEDRVGQKVNDGRKTPIDNAFQRAETQRKNIHPTVKPIKLMSYLVILGSRPGDIILDPFMGSGTTCIAAKALGRKYIGIELDYEYYKIALSRLGSIPQRLAI